MDCCCCVAGSRRRCVAAIWSADNEDFHMLTGLRPAICSQHSSSVRQQAFKAEASNAVAHLRTCPLSASTSVCVCLTWSSESKQDTPRRKAGFTHPSLGDLRDRSAAADSLRTQINILAWCSTCTTANTLSGLLKTVSMLILDEFVVRINNSRCCIPPKSHEDPKVPGPL